MVPLGMLPRASLAVLWLVVLAGCGANRGGVDAPPDPPTPEPEPEPAPVEPPASWLVLEGGDEGLAWIAPDGAPALPQAGSASGGSDAAAACKAWIEAFWQAPSDAPLEDGAAAVHIGAHAVLDEADVVGDIRAHWPDVTVDVLVREVRETGQETVLCTASVEVRSVEDDSDHLLEDVMLDLVPDAGGWRASSLTSTLLSFVTSGDPQFDFTRTLERCTLLVGADGEVEHKVCDYQTIFHVMDPVEGMPGLFSSTVLWGIELAVLDPSGRTTAIHLVDSPDTENPDLAMMNMEFPIVHVKGITEVDLGIGVPVVRLALDGQRDPVPGDWPSCEGNVRFEGVQFYGLFPEGPRRIFAAQTEVRGCEGMVLGTGAPLLAQKVEVVPGPEGPSEIRVEVVEARDDSLVGTVTGYAWDGTEYVK